MHILYSYSYVLLPVPLAISLASKCTRVRLTHTRYRARYAVVPRARGPRPPARLVNVDESISTCWYTSYETACTTVLFSCTGHAISPAGETSKRLVVREARKESGLCDELFPGSGLWL